MFARLNILSLSLSWALCCCLCCPQWFCCVLSYALRQCETHSQCVSLALSREPLKLSFLHSIVFHIALRRCETPPSPLAPDPVGMENCKQLFSPLLAITTQKIATHSTDIISAVCVAFLWVVNASRNEKSCLQFLIPTAVFHILLTEMLRKKDIFR